MNILDPADELPTKRRTEDTDTMVMDTKLKIIEILKVRISVTYITHTKHVNKRGNYLKN